MSITATIPLLSLSRDDSSQTLNLLFVSPPPPQSPSSDSSDAPSSLFDVSSFLHRMNSRRRLLSTLSFSARGTATDQIDRPRRAWAHTAKIVMVDIICNTVFAFIAFIVVLLSNNETPKVPLRLWLLVYGVQCIIHMVCVCAENQRRRRVDSFLKRMKEANSVFSYIWWIVGFCWILSRVKMLSQDAPTLFGLTIIFLAYDVSYKVITIVVSYIINEGLEGCLPCIIPFRDIHTASDQEESSEDVIEGLAKYKFKILDEIKKTTGDIQGPYGGIMVECDATSPIERALSAEDAVCAICFCEYENGSELRELPCRHHFHCACIDKWLHIESYCPLCKYYILKNAKQSMDLV